MADLNEMLVFVRVISRGSFSAAARDVGVPPSTLSRKVAALEQRLGTQLMERTTRRLRLTEAGALYYEHCQRIAELVEEADAAVDELSAAPRGVLRITAPPAWGQVFLAEPVAAYLARYPDMRVDIVLSTQTSDLAAEGFDLGIRWTPRVEGGNLVARRLGGSTPVPCASPGYIEAHGAPRSLDDLAEHAIIGVGRDAPQLVWRFLDGGGDAIPLPLEPRVRVDSPWLARALCRAGVGIALLPSYLAEPEFVAGALQRILPEIAPRPLSLYVVFPDAVRRTAKLRAFLDVLYQHFGQTAPWS